MRKNLPKISDKNNKEIENMEGIKSFPVDCEVSPLAKKIYKILQDYNDIAETGNIQWELGLGGRQIANAMRNLIRLKMVKRIGRGCLIDNEFGGSTYKIIKVG